MTGWKRWLVGTLVVVVIAFVTFFVSENVAIRAITVGWAGGWVAGRFWGYWVAGPQVRGGG